MHNNKDMPEKKKGFRLVKERTGILDDIIECACQIGSCFFLSNETQKFILPRNNILYLCRGIPLIIDELFGMRILNVTGY